MIDDQPANISYSLQENKGEEVDTPNLSYEDLLNEVTTSADAIPDQLSDSEYEYDYSMDAMAGMDDYIATELDYQTNYIKKDLERIADYYEISKRKKRKDQLVEDMKSSDSYKSPVKYKYNLVYRYYYNGNIIKEIKIEPQDFK